MGIRLPPIHVFSSIVVHHAGVRRLVPGAIQRSRPARGGFHPRPNEAFGVPAALPAGCGDGHWPRWAGSGKFNRPLSARLPPRPLPIIHLSLGSTGINRPLGLTGAGIFYFTRIFRLWVGGRSGMGGGFNVNFSLGMGFRGWLGGGVIFSVGERLAILGVFRLYGMGWLSGRAVAFGAWRFPLPTAALAILGGVMA